MKTLLRPYSYSINFFALYANLGWEGIRSTYRPYKPNPKLVSLWLTLDPVPVVAHIINGLRLHWMSTKSFRLDELELNNFKWALNWLFGPIESLGPNLWAGPNLTNRFCVHYLLFFLGWKQILCSLLLLLFCIILFIIVWIINNFFKSKNEACLTRNHPPTRVGVTQIWLKRK